MRSGFGSKFDGRLKPVMHYPANTSKIDECCSGEVTKVSGLVNL